MPAGSDRRIGDRGGANAPSPGRCGRGAGHVERAALPALRPGRQGKDRLLVEAKEIVYDNDKNTVSASGDVELYYQGRTLQADRVIYDRNTRPGFRRGQRPPDRSGWNGHRRATGSS